LEVATVQARRMTASKQTGRGRRLREGEGGVGERGEETGGVRSIARSMM